jgi:hypothetical protein
MIKNPSFK